MSNKFEPLNPNEVVSVDKSAKILLAHPTFKVVELLEAAMFLFKSNDELTRKQGAVEEKIKWISHGVKCQVLKYGAKGWQKGKVRLTLEFCPDEPEIEELPTNKQTEMTEPESPLDDLRRMINENMNGAST